jgi:AraC-like DNA-binding protein
MQGKPPMAINKVSFRSDELSSGLNDEATFKRWRDIYCATLGEADVERMPDRGFSARCEAMQIGTVCLTRFEATIRQVSRSRRQVASDQRNDFFVGFNHGDQQFLAQHGREATGPSVFFTNGEPIVSHMSGNCSIVGLCIPRARIMELVPGAEDLIAQPLAVGEASRYLDQYVDFLLTSGSVEPRGPLTPQIELALVDLLALSLGASRDAQELGQMRGLRAARFQAILAAIRLGFSDPAFAVHDVARGLGLTARYVQNLLSETEASFSERVLELRLQKARAMLASLQGSRMKISDIAFACGFSEVSYFNRCFRRRFGASPTQCRGGHGSGGSG